MTTSMFIGILALVCLLVGVVFAAITNQFSSAVFWLVLSIAIVVVASRFST